MIKRLKEVFHIISSDAEETEKSKTTQTMINGIVSGLLALVSLVLSIINITTQKWDMMITTLFLMVVFAISSLLLLIKKQRKIPEVLITICIVVVFTYYAAHGKNDGFAILWILLAPAIATLFFSFKRGIIVSLYYLLLLIFIFYVPFIFPGLKEILPAYKDGVPGFYDQFIIRFPVLYLSTFIVSIFLNAQKIYYSRIAEKNSVRDAMTSLKNRRYYNDFTNLIGFDSKVEHDFTIVSIDINNLKLINDNLGHDYGDDAIIKTSEILEEVFGGITSDIFRTGGDEFSIFFIDKNNKISEIEKKLKTRAQEEKIGDQSLSFSVGYVKGRDFISSSFKDLLNIAESNMYKDKQKYYEKFETKRVRNYSSHNKY